MSSLPSIYILGLPHKRLGLPPTTVLIVLTPLDDGRLISRSTCPDAFQHIYPRRTSLETALLEWIHLELSQPMILWRREEVKALLADSHPASSPPLGHLQGCDTALSPRERAERVLQHLERCW